MGDGWWSLSHEGPCWELLGLPHPVDFLVQGFQELPWCERVPEAQANGAQARHGAKKPDFTVLEVQGQDLGPPCRSRAQFPWDT